jgi:polar amino acid transport system permease protein
LHYEWNFGPVLRNADILLAGAIGTVQLVVLSLLLAVPLGLALAAVRLGRIPVVSQLATIYVEFFRAAPSIVLIYWCFFALPVLVSVQFSPLTAAVLAVGLQAAAFLCEVFRSGIASIPKGQWEASRALGMDLKSIFGSIILPQAIRNMLPVFLNRLIDLIKTTALAAAIAYSEIVYAAFMISSSTYRPIETFTVLGVIFFVVIFTISLGTRVLERRLMKAGG